MGIKTSKATKRAGTPMQDYSCELGIGAFMGELRSIRRNEDIERIAVSSVRSRSARIDHFGDEDGWALGV